ncbi:glycine dehydrogenase [Streptomyces virginiae]|uniref:Glycine dehydrogenase (decarboxylating) n=1 Tax=Streptomyces virginiae TaxID=1961 RepID=A0A0L8MYH7_STRVG|nr:aminomethyl-transferring glycine dehydrogenase [Streptomyces virginiae]KOG55477.1 glycine dehydrogenase [Streptomyces virginiae]
MTEHITLSELENRMPYMARHIGVTDLQADAMAAFAGYGSRASLADAAMPETIRDTDPVFLPAAADESTVLEELAGFAALNKPMTQMIGQGYHDTITPSVILRNVLESPAWYTAYTPYQPEVSQGRLEALMNFQTMVADLTGLATANASLLDESTAAAEAMALVRRVSKASSACFVVDSECLPQTIAVVLTRARPLGIDVVVRSLSEGMPEELFGLLLQYPGTSGVVRDYSHIVQQAHDRGALVTVAADPLALVLLRSPGAIGADVVVGSAQRFGCPLGFGGPHPGFMAVRKELRRQLPGRLVGMSVDMDGSPAYRLALQTREQHIRREKATSNICTASVLPAVVAGMYAVYHGKEGLHTIAARVHRYAILLAAGLRAGGVEVVHQHFFDTVLARVPGRAAQITQAALEKGINVRMPDSDHVGIACDEVTRREILLKIWAAFDVPCPDIDALDTETASGLEATLLRSDSILSAPVFNRYRSETAMLRYLRGLADKDYALDRGMIPLGSCTMKLTPTTAMRAITWPQFAGIHPFAPLDQAEGYLKLIQQLQQWLADITGYEAVSLQPNSGAQGEYAGLLAIRAYQAAKGETNRDVCLMPESAHGTNAASAAMAGLRIATVTCDEHGNIDLTDLEEKVSQYRRELAVLMVTYPSTHGVFDESIVDICQLAHRAGAQVYLDGANLNALAGLARPGRFGSDVSHVNIHKTFGNPHGGGGPGIGPVCVGKHLAPYLPSHPAVRQAGPAGGVGPVAGAPWGSAGFLPISWAYLRLMGPQGLIRATQTAILSANYIARRLRPYYSILYTGPADLVAHECIIDIRPLEQQTGITVTDVVKRLADFGFHAPTVSFPVPGTMMVEPTESEDQAELDRFCEAMIAIRAEIAKVGAGHWPATDNPLCNAPHTAASLAGLWDHPYSREEAAFPLPGLRERKYWPSVRRIDDVHGDRNLVCSCPSVTAYDIAGEPDNSNHEERLYAVGTPK